MSTRIETPRLVIRTFEPGDGEAWIALVNDPEVRRFLPPAPDATTETFQKVIQQRHAMEHEIGYSMWAVDDKATGVFVGQCGIRPVEEDAAPEIELAYHYTRGSWNRGYATEAAIAVLTHAFGPAGLDRVMAVAMPENVGSWRVMEKAGMRYEGLVNLFGLEGLKKYAAGREWWRPPRVLSPAGRQSALRILWRAVDPRPCHSSSLCCRAPAAREPADEESHSEVHAADHR